MFRVYEYIKYKEYKQIIYLKAKEKIERAEDENIIYLIKYEKDKQNIEEENIIYIVLDNEKDEEKLVEENIDEITKDKNIIYLLENDKNKEDIEKDKNIYISYILFSSPFLNSKFTYEKNDKFAIIGRIKRQIW